MDMNFILLKYRPSLLKNKMSFRFCSMNFVLFTNIPPNFSKQGDFTVKKGYGKILSLFR